MALHGGETLAEDDKEEEEGRRGKYTPNLHRRGSIARATFLSPSDCFDWIAVEGDVIREVHSYDFMYDDEEEAAAAGYFDREIQQPTPNTSGKNLLSMLAGA